MGCLDLDHPQWFQPFNTIQDPLFQFPTFHIIFSLFIQHSFNFYSSNGFSFNTLPHHFLFLLFLFNFCFYNYIKLSIIIKLK